MSCVVRDGIIDDTSPGVGRLVADYHYQDPGGNGPFPPQGDRTVAEYAQASTRRRGFLPDAIMNAFFLAATSVGLETDVDIDTHGLIGHSCRRFTEKGGSLSTGKMLTWSLFPRQKCVTGFRHDEHPTDPGADTDTIPYLGTLGEGTTARTKHIFYKTHPPGTSPRSWSGQLKRTTNKKLSMSQRKVKDDVLIRSGQLATTASDCRMYGSEKAKSNPFVIGTKNLKLEAIRTTSHKSHLHTISCKISKTALPEETAAVKALTSMKAAQFENCMDNRFGDVGSGILSDTKIVSFQQWPDPENSADISDFGDSEVDRLKSHFKPILISSGVDVDLIADQWTVIKSCLYKEPQTLEKITWAKVNRMLRETCPDFLDLVDLVLCIPASTGDCERGFNVMKMVKSDWQSSLKCETLSDLLFVHLSSPSIKDFDPSTAVEMWHDSSIR
ncbi:hypothetical protein E1301_Tti012717 [Triplophysa tibetana]|uniref:HAT C-terminal dimerisation domain-containing protein n=1 Tax=Triplophysa tibetana TaxID=1572043 RepID=A0A5A9NSU9_9TELE|nr:hypothetical protein E1301_Tti012717 [Triplophysa tibetana]